jgi:pimeloyl-ACP methyl ester carboxylesterase
MTTISRRVVLQGSYAAAAMLGAAKFANARDLASLNVTESAARLASQDLPCGKLRDEIFYRVDWLGAPWINPEPILLIHGNDESSLSWFGWVPRMAQEFRLIRPDLPGFGHSTIPSNFDWTMANIATTQAHVLDALEIESAHVVGAKSGGSIAMQFAADYPTRTRTLTLVSAPVTRVDSKIAFSAPSESSQRRRLGSAASKEMVEYWNSLMSSTRPETKTGMAKVEAALNMESVLPRIAAPTLVITSDRSSLQSVETVLKYQTKIMNSRLVVLSSDGYHLAVIKADECVTSVLSFLREVGRSS